MALDQSVPPRERSDGSEDTSEPPRRGPARTVLAVLACVTAFALLLVVALQLTGGVRPAVQRIVEDRAVAPSQDAVLADVWTSYKARFLEEGTHRTVDTSQNGTTTSEGQSYTMMRAVWMDDRTTFDQSWQWAKDNIQRPDRLLSWRFGPRADGTYGVQTDQGGQNAASDADVDVAFALLMAYSRWADDDYLYDAAPLIDAVWQYEVVDVAGSPVLAANDLERQNPESVLVNPSYFAPYAYRAFARVDPGHDWDGLVDSSYRVLEQVSTGELEGRQGVGLVPDWVRLDRATGEASVATGISTAGADSTAYGYEALRLPWRLALDLRWNGEERARPLLELTAKALGDSWESTGALAAVYGRDGAPAVDYSSVAMHGGALGALEVARPVLARQVYDAELLAQYDPDTRTVSTDVGYYDANWMWFGMALHLDRLPDLNAADGSDLP